MHKRHSGFTIVELLIVIVVIAILAAITIVSYRGINDRAQTSALTNDLSAAAKRMELARVDNGEQYPSALPAGVSASPGNVLQLTSVADSTKQFCINAYGPGNKVMSVRNDGGISPFLCPGATIGNPVGGSVPTAPRGVNLVSDFSTWTTTGGVTYDATNKELVFNGTGNALSPLIRIDNARLSTVALQSYSTTASTTFTPQSGVYFSSYYYAADGTTPVNNTSSYTSNGNAQRTDLSTWANYSWTTPTGPGIIYIRYRVYSSPSNYTSDNHVRNVTVTVSD